MSLFYPPTDVNRGISQLIIDVIKLSPDIAAITATAHPLLVPRPFWCTNELSHYFNRSEKLIQAFFNLLQCLTSF